MPPVLPAIRMSRRCISRACVLSGGSLITARDLPADLKKEKGTEGKIDSLCLGDAVAQTEKHLILRALSRVQGKRTEAATLLGISRKNLWEKMKMYGITI